MIGLVRILDVFERGEEIGREITRENGRIRFDQHGKNRQKLVQHSARCTFKEPQEHGRDVISRFRLLCIPFLVEQLLSQLQIHGNQRFGGLESRIGGEQCVEQRATPLHGRLSCGLHKTAIKHAEDKREVLASDLSE